MLIHACRKRLLTVRASPNMLKKCIRTDLRLCMNVTCSSLWGRVMFVAPLFTPLHPPEMELYIMPCCMMQYMCAFDLSWKSFWVYIKPLKANDSIPHTLKTRGRPFFFFCLCTSECGTWDGGYAEIWSELLGSPLLARQCCKHPVWSIC